MSKFIKTLDNLTKSDSELLKVVLTYAIDFSDEFYMNNREEIIQLAKKIFPSVPEHFWRAK